jgi:hypothetical protein
MPIIKTHDCLIADIGIDIDIGISISHSLSMRGCGSGLEHWSVTDIRVRLPSTRVWNG